MSSFRYKAQDSLGRLVNGVSFAGGEGELHHKLKAEGLLLLSCRPCYAISSRFTLKPSVLADFNRQLGQLLGSGISVVRSIRIMLRDEALRPRQRAIYEDLLRLIRQGRPISDALEAQGAFPPLMISMYRAAEAGGSLDKTASRLAVKYEREHRLNLKVKNATAYAKVLGVLTFFVLIVMFAIVLPRFEIIFADAKLPASTRLLLAVRDIFKYHAPVVLLGASAAIFAVKALAKLRSVSLLLDKAKLRLPIIGRLLQSIYTSRFARTLSSLYAAGLPIVPALQTAVSTVGNEYIKRQFDAVISEVRTGGSLSSALERVGGFSVKMSVSVRIGEESGTLELMLSSLSEVLEYEAEASLTRLVSFLEPVMIVIMALIVGFIVIAIITPVFSGYSALGEGYI